MWENHTNFEDEMGSSPSKHLLEEAMDSFPSSIRRSAPVEEKKIERERERGTTKIEREREEEKGFKGGSLHSIPR